MKWITKMRWGRVVAMWIVMMVAETTHGIVRTLVLTPAMGDFRARQVGVLTGSLLILVIAYLLLPWSLLRTRRSFIGAGLSCSC